MRVSAAVAVACLSMGLATADDAKAAAKKETTIRAQGLEPALNQLAQDRDVQLVYRSEVVGERQTSGAVGELTFDEALTKLLDGTGLTYQYIDDRAITIIPMDARPSAQASALRPQAAEGGGRKRFRLAQSETQTSTPSTRRTSDPADAQSKVDVVLEEVIVTAQKREQRLQDVPISVTAFSSQQLKEIGAVDVKSVLLSVPGLSFTNANRGATRYSIRGISSQAAAPTVGVYLDDIALGVFLGQLGSYDAVLFDIERLEVLKGPQGTLYGGSAMGGAIKYVSARPELSRASGSTAAGVATTAHGDLSYHAEGVVNLPIISDVLGIRAGVYYLHEGGFIDNVANADLEYAATSTTPSPVYTPSTRSSLSTISGDDQNFGDTYVGRFSLLWQPDSSWTVRPSIVYQDSKRQYPATVVSTLGGFTSSWRFPDLEFHDRMGIYSLDVTKTLGGSEVTSLTAYSNRRTLPSSDFSYFVAPGNSSVAVVPNETQTLSQEIRIASAESSSRWAWVAGLYYGERDWFQLSQIIRAADVYNVDPIRSNLTFHALTSEDVTEYAAFGDVTYSLTDALDITAGARLYRFESAWDRVTTLPTQTQTVADTEDQGVNPKFGLSYRLGDAKLLYASAAKGFRVGGVSTSIPSYEVCAQELSLLGYSSRPTHFESDSLWTYEIGSKNEFDAGRLALNAALFYSDWKEIQQTVALPQCGFSFTANAGVARVQGVEVESRFAVTPAMEIGVNAGYTDAQITEAAYGTPIVNGDRVLNTPEWTASAYGSLNFPIGQAWSLKLRADYQYRGNQRTQFPRGQTVTYSDGVVGVIPYKSLYQEDYDVLNAFASFEKGPLVVRLYVQNALDAHPALDPVSGGTFSQSTAMRPRTVGLEVRWSGGRQ